MDFLLTGPGCDKPVTKLAKCLRSVDAAFASVRELLGQDSNLQPSG